MNSKLVKVLGAISGALMLVIIGEWFYASRSQQQLLAIRPAIDKKALTEEMPAIDLTAQVEESYADLVNRPLFIEGRKPVKEPPPAEAASNAALTVKFDWVLNGVYTTPKGLSALLTRAVLKTPKDNYRRAKTGDTVDGWTLIEIKKDRIWFDQSGERKELLLHKPKPKHPPPKPGTPPPDGQQPEAVPAPGEVSEEPENLMPDIETPEDSIENSNE
jgi:hypothetical protein